MKEAAGGTPHAIAYLRVLGEDGDVVRVGSVRCPRQGGSVPLARCARCPRFVKVDPGAAPGDESVYCEAGFEPSEPSAAPLVLSRLSVSALMTRNVMCVRPALTLDALSALFLETGLAAVPVVDDRYGLMGFVSQDDMTLAIQVGSVGPNRALTVADVLLPFAVAVPESTSVTQAAAVMAFEGQQRLAVTSAGGAVVGVLSAGDVLYWLARSDGHLLPPPRTSCRP
jgi:CBS domain-containing protein